MRIMIPGSTMTFAEIFAAIGQIAGDSAWSLQVFQVSIWGGVSTGTLALPRWQAYRDRPWIGTQHQIEAPTPELLLERVRAALASATPTSMTAVRP